MVSAVGHIHMLFKLLIIMYLVLEKGVVNGTNLDLKGIFCNKKGPKVSPGRFYKYGDENSIKRDLLITNFNQPACKKKIRQFNYARLCLCNYTCKSRFRPACPLKL